MSDNGTQYYQDLSDWFNRAAQYRALEAELLTHLRDAPPDEYSWSVMENEQRVAAAVCRATGMTSERWDRLLPPQRAPYLEAAIESLSAKPQAKRKGRPRRDEKESATKVLAALCKHHGYENGSVTNYAPATNRGLAKDFELASNALTRFLNDKESTHREYMSACRRDTIGRLLALWQGELPSRLPDLTADEYGRSDD